MTLFVRSHSENGWLRMCRPLVNGLCFAYAKKRKVLHWQRERTKSVTMMQSIDDDFVSWLRLYRIFFLFFVHYCALTVLRCISIGSRIVCLQTISFHFNWIYIYIYASCLRIYISCPITLFSVLDSNLLTETQQKNIPLNSRHLNWNVILNARNDSPRVWVAVLRK